MLACTCRVREAVRNNLPIVDVDGSYLYRKQLRLGFASRGAQIDLPLPTPPLSGWDQSIVRMLVTCLPMFLV